MHEERDGARSAGSRRRGRLGCGWDAVGSVHRVLYCCTAVLVVREAYVVEVGSSA